MKNTVIAIIWNLLKWSLKEGKILDSIYTFTKIAEARIEGGAAKKSYVLDMLSQEPYKSALTGLTGLLVNWLVETAVVKLKVADGLTKETLVTTEVEPTELPKE